MRASCAIVVSCCVLLISGCVGKPVMTTTSTQTNPVQGAAIKGRVHGGQNPISGADVYLYAVGTGGYGGKGIAASSSNASVSLLNSNVLSQTPAGGEDSNNNYYVTTDSGGNFSITGDYTCPSASAQVYLFAKGGNSGAGPNSLIGLMAGLGSCGSLSSSTFVMVNEVSTIVTAYALAGFATDATHISSSGSTLALQGMANAFAAIPNMETLSTGVALATTPAGNGVVWQKGINAMANILASCVNTASGAGYCSSLLLIWNLGLAGPTETASVAIDFAHFPGSNVSTLLEFQSANPPFQPTTTATNDFTMGIAYTGAFTLPIGVAVDSADNVWITDEANSTDNTAISELYAAGYTGAGGGSTWNSSSPFTGGGLSGCNCYSIAIDPSGNIWAGPSGGSGLIELSSSGSPLSPSTGYQDNGYFPYTVASDGSGNIWNPNATAMYEYVPGTGFEDFSGGGVDEPDGVAVDAAGNVWVANVNGTLSEFNSSGVASGGSPYSGASAGDTGADCYGEDAAVDASGNIWVPSYNALAEFNSSGGPASGSSGYTGGGLNNACGIAIDGAGNVWVANWTGGSISEFNSTGNPISGSGGYFPVNNFYNPAHIAIDGSGNVWVTATYGPYLVEVVGAATPVVTPMSANLKAPYGSHAVNKP